MSMPGLIGSPLLFLVYSGPFATAGCIAAKTSPSEGTLGVACARLTRPTGTSVVLADCGNVLSQA